MNITIELIKLYRPCQEGIDNFEAKYSTFNAPLIDLLRLEDIDYSDKIWLALRICDTKTLQMWAVLCAESVLHIYEDVYLSDTRVRNCLEVTKKVINGELGKDSLEFKNVYSAVRKACKGATYMLARHAAQSMAFATDYCVEKKADYYTANSALFYAVKSLTYETEKEQENLNLMLLMSLL